MYEKGLCYYIGKLLYPLLNFFFKVTINGAYIILVGFLSGYPLGAKVIGEMVSSGNISKAEGKYLITFCNNTSISFLINYIICTCLKSSLPVLGDTKLTTLHIVLFVFLPSIITGILNKLILNFRETHYPAFQTSINTLSKNENIIKKNIFFSNDIMYIRYIFFSINAVNQYHTTIFFSKKYSNFIFRNYKRLLSYNKVSSRGCLQNIFYASMCNIGWYFYFYAILIPNKR